MKTTKDKFNNQRPGSVRNYMPDPAEVLAQNNIDIVNAESEAANDPLVQSLSAVGSFLMTNAGGINGAITKKALGGKTGSKVEVEGKEVAETPLGDVLEFIGPSHKQGGIKTILPDDTYVYPDQIKIDGDTMAKRKKVRVKQEIDIEKSLASNMADSILKNTLSRVKNNNEIEDAYDKKVQTLIEFAAELSKKGKTKKLAKGGKVGDKKGFDLGLTSGDATGFIGNFVSALGPLLNTMNNRGGDTPNINTFEDFGKEGLDTLDSSKKYVDHIQDKALVDLARGTHSKTKQIRNSSRGVNTMRAGDLSVFEGNNKAKQDIYDMSSKQMLGILSEQSKLETQRDGVVMQGDYQKDLADRQDRDAYFTARATDITSLGAGLQETGKDMNAIKQNNVSENLVNQISKYGFTFDSEGNIIPPKAQESEEVSETVEEENTFEGYDSKSIPTYEEWVSIWNEGETGIEPTKEMYKQLFPVKK